jgi:radical SAM protein with 4Fe4S-binding SPASM domain
MQANQNFAVKKSIRSANLFTRSQPPLSHIDIELTERCNNTCLHCYINQTIQNTKVKTQELTTNQWKDIIQQAADLGAFSIRFTGGEPLLRDDFSDIYLYTRRLGMKVVIFTNACLITEELADLFAKVPPLMKIEISVYGMTAQTYNKVTGKTGAFDEFRNGMDHLLKRDIPIHLKSVVLPQNYLEMIELEQHTTEILGIKMSPADPVILNYRARRDSPVKNRSINKMRFSSDEYLALISRHGKAYRDSMTKFITHFLYPQGDVLFNCGAGDTGCVDAYGKYQMCMLLRHPDMVYDLKDGTLREGLTEVFPRFKDRRATNPEYLKRCANCFIKGLCEQCPGKSWSEHGTLDTPVEYLCQLAHTQAYYLGLLMEGEFAWEVKYWKDRIERITR